MDAIHLPSLNALLNTTSATLLGLGYYFIRRGNIVAHKRAMTGAFCVSTLFLVSYLYYHYTAGSTRFQGQGLLRVIYLSILLSHTVLAMAVAPMAIATFWRALSGRFVEHRKIARLTWPLWIYVSITGVVVYVMLYRL
jgi:putative membrane protein